jgi:hypothetical protein
MMKTNLLGVAFAVSIIGATFVHAQQPLAEPNETDVRASYCSAVMFTLDIPRYEKVMDALVESDTTNPARDELYDSLNMRLYKSRVTLRKLSLYLGRRVGIFNLDPVPLTKASFDASRDITKVDAANDICLPDCSTVDVSAKTECMNVCGERKMPGVDAIKKKFEGCRDVGWLPPEP